MEVQNLMITHHDDDDTRKPPQQLHLQFVTAWPFHTVQGERSKRWRTEEDEEQEEEETRRKSGHTKLCSRGHWRPHEDAKLKELVAQFGPQNWNLIADKLQGRSGK